MLRRPFTDRLVASLSSNGKPQFEHYDAGCPGLLIRVTLAGHKTWGFVFTNPVSGKRARMTLGVYSEAKGLKAARTLANEARTKMEAGKDPRVIETVPRKKTVRELFEDRWAMEIVGQFRTADAIKWRFDKYILPHIGDLPVEEFRVDPHYHKVVRNLLAEEKRRQAGILYNDLKALLNFGEKHEVIDRSPLARLDRPDRYVPRKRFLSHDEIRQFCLRLPCALPKSKHARAILMLALALGQRVGEIAGMRKSELCLTANRPYWTIPAERLKNGDTYGPHVVPLNDIALEIIRDAMRDTSGDYLFPRRDGAGPLNSDMVSQFVRLAHKRGAFGMVTWTPHDLRRTVGTQMLSKGNRLNISRFDKALILNHRSVTKANVSDIVYDQNEYFDEKYDALAKWGALLARLTCPKPAAAEDVRIAAE